jgi:hypothetical protein
VIAAAIGPVVLSDRQPQNVATDWAAKMRHVEHRIRMLDLNELAINSARSAHRCKDFHTLADSFSKIEPTVGENMSSGL